MESNYLTQTMKANIKQREIEDCSEEILNIRFIIFLRTFFIFMLLVFVIGQLEAQVTIGGR